MEVNDDLDAYLPRPINRLIHIRRRAARIRGVRVVVRPEADRYPDEVEPSIRDLLKIRQLHPAIPVRLEDTIVRGLVP